MKDKLLTDAINRDYLRDEESILSELLPLATLNSELSDQVNICATQLERPLNTESGRSDESNNRQLSAKSGHWLIYT